MVSWKSDYKNKAQSGETLRSGIIKRFQEIESRIK